MAQERVEHTVKHGCESRLSVKVVTIHQENHTRHVFLSLTIMQVARKFENAQRTFRLNGEASEIHTKLVELELTRYALAFPLWHLEEIGQVIVDITYVIEFRKILTHRAKHP